MSKWVKRLRKKRIRDIKNMPFPWFDCKYAIQHGCSIKGWKKKGKKSLCPVFRKGCTHCLKCDSCLNYPCSESYTCCNADDWRI